MLPCWGADWVVVTPNAVLWGETERSVVLSLAAPC